MAPTDVMQGFAGGAGQHRDLVAPLSQDGARPAVAVLLSGAVALAFVVIAARGWCGKRALRDTPSGLALGRLKAALVLCGLCACAVVAVTAIRPAWRLCDLLMVGLACYAWRYARTAAGLKTVYDELDGAARLAGDLRQCRTEQELTEERVRSRTAELERAVAALREQAVARQRAADLLAAERNLLHTLIDALPDRIWVKDAGGRYVLNNAAHLRFLGAASREAAAGKTVSDFLSADVAGPYHEEDLRAALAGRSVALEPASSVDHAGQTVWVSRIKVPLRGPHGAVVGVLGVARDVTQNLQSEAALRESELRFRSVAQSAGDAILSTDARGNVSFWNRAAERIFGYAEDEVVGRPVATLMPERYRAAHQAGLDRLAGGGASTLLGRPVELEGLRKDGSAFPIELCLGSWRTPDGVFFSGTVRDITERRRAEDALRSLNATLEQRVADRSAAAEERAKELARSGRELRRQTAILQSVLDSMADGVVVAGQDGSLQLCNPAAVRLLDVDPQAAAGEDWCHRCDLFLPDAVTPCPPADRPIALALRGVEVDDVEAFARHRNAPGGVWLSASARSLTDEEGTVRGAVCVLRDVGYRKRVEAELHQAKEAAEAASQAKTEFLANMSHEIRTPMTAILGYADRLLIPDQSLSDRQDAIQVIRRNGGHLLDLINDVLDISKIEAGEMTVGAIETDLPQLLADVASMIRPRAAAKGLDFKVEFDGPIPRRVRTDPLRTKQILVNLLANAVKFTPGGRVSLRASCDAGGPSMALRFDVRDTGIGMSPDQVARLFKPFTQADESTTRRFGGTGLGLTISRRLATLLGGDVSVRSDLGAGSTFTAAIDGGPADGAGMMDGLDEAALPAAVGYEAARHVALRGRILVAEDGRDNQALLRAHLGDAGADVTVAENGRVAVDLATARPFDLILMDMQMPELDGYDAAAELRRRGLTLPIVALTAHAMADDRAKCLASGCDDYLTKPIDHARLLYTVGRYLGSPRSDVADQARTAAVERPGAGGGDRPSEAAVPATGAAAALVGVSDQGTAASPAEPVRSSYAAMPKMKKILDEFVAHLPAEVADMRGRLAANDLPALRRLAHQLRGAGGGYGFPRLSDLAGELEDALKQQADAASIAARCEALASFIRRIDGYDASGEVAAGVARAHAS